MHLPKRCVSLGFTFFIQLVRLIIKYIKSFALPYTEKEFPDCTVTLCHFHVCQAQQRKIDGAPTKGYGLHWEYRNDGRFEKCAKLFRAIPFGPPEEARNLFAAIINSELWDDRLQHFAEVYYQVSLFRINWHSRN